MRSVPGYAVAVSLLFSTLPALAGEQPAHTAPAGETDTKLAPGYEDFEDRSYSPREIEELEERRDDRNIVSPGERDEKELDREMGLD